MQTAERKAERAAARKRQAELDQLVGIADKVVVVTEVRVDYEILTTLCVVVDGVTIKGERKDFNIIIERLGYRPVRITSNLLNPASKRFCIDINTPSYLDPGSEAYHSM